MWEVEVRRGEMVESRHSLWAAAIGTDGSVIFESTPGDAARTVFLRSAAKPFQAAGAVDAGVPARFGLDDRHLAVACASHGGDDSSVALVQEILTAAGLDAGDLDPGDDGQGGRLQHQCSGNHALALAWCVAAGWATNDYLDPAHPVQIAMTTQLAAAADEPLVAARDNCGMTTHGASLASIGRMYLILARADDATRGLGRVGAAMRTHPEIVGSTPGIDTELMVANPGLVAKVGAEGLCAAATPETALVVRVGDGSMRALVPAVRALAERWCGWKTGGPPSGAAPHLDAHGTPIGELVAVETSVTE